MFAPTQDVIGHRFEKRDSDIMNPRYSLLARHSLILRTSRISSRIRPNCWRGQVLLPMQLRSGWVTMEAQRPNSLRQGCLLRGRGGKAPSRDVVGEVRECHDALFAFWHRLDCWCCLNAHWFPLTTIPQCSQSVVGASRIQLAGRSPTSSRLEGLT